MLIQGFRHLAKSQDASDGYLKTWAAMLMEAAMRRKQARDKHADHAGALLMSVDDALHQQWRIGCVAA